jgi:hypothetical protein
VTAIATSRIKVAEAVLIHMSDALSVRDGGFSVHIGSGAAAREGFAVSIYPQFERRVRGLVTVQYLAGFVTEHALPLTRPDVVFGGWRDPRSTIAYLDLSIVVPDRAQALRLARLHGQRAIWDFASAESICVDEWGR